MSRQLQQPPASKRGQMQMWIILGAPVVLMIGLMIVGLFWRFSMPSSRQHYAPPATNTGTATATNQPVTGN